ncbi:MAG: SufE family protein [Chlamydiia bacterium]|nr:SufE family protein [Chlamydiia bacterium]
MDFQSCLDKQNHIQKKFSLFKTQEEKYRFIMEIGRNSPPMPQEEQKEENRVPGCQSLLYLSVQCIEGKLKILTHSDALISAGLAHLLTQVYEGEAPEAVIHCPPLFLKEIGLLNILSPTRANGLKSLYQTFQKKALQWIG